MLVERALRGRRLRRQGHGGQVAPGVDDRLRFELRVAGVSVVEQGGDVERSRGFGEGLRLGGEDLRQGGGFRRLDRRGSGLGQLVLFRPDADRVEDALKKQGGSLLEGLLKKKN